MSEKEKPKMPPPAKGAAGKAPAKAGQAADPAAPGLSALMTRKWFAPAVLAGLAVLAFGVLQLGKSSDGKKSAPPPPDPTKTGSLVVKSGRANATFEVTRTPPAADGAARVEVSAGQPAAGLLPGRYAVTGHAPGWPDARAEATVAVGQTAEVTVDFPSGALQLDSDPTGATVRQGETTLGKTPLKLAELPPGECKLTLDYPAWPPLEFTTTITANTTATAKARLPHGRLVAETVPAGATVTLDGKPVGQTPLTLDPVPAGPKKLTLEAKDFPTLNVNVTVKDDGEGKVSLQLGAYYPALDPAALLRAVWVPDNKDNLVPAFDGLSGPSAPRNGIVKNLNRKRLYENWLRKWYHFSGTIKAYDAAKAQVEFVEDKSDLARFRVLATLSPEAQNNKDLVAQLTKGATLNFYGKLTGLEEPRWPFKVFTFELAAIEQLH